jgi:excisionase family DNA binding protein
MQNINDPMPQSTRESAFAVDSFEAARLLGVSERHLRTLAKAGTVASVRLGGRVVYPIADLQQLLSPSKAEG